MGLNPRYIPILVLLISLGCSSSKWIIEDNTAIDRTEFELVANNQFLKVSETPTPEKPIVGFQVWDTNTYEYAQKIKMGRYLQRYRPSFLGLVLGASGAYLSYLSSQKFSNGSFEQYMLLGTAGLSLALGMIGDREMGTSLATGEERLLKRTGTIELTDTLLASRRPLINPTYTIYSGNEAVAIRNEVNFDGNSYQINLLEELNPNDFTFDEQQNIRIELDFNDSTYIYPLTITDIFERFVVVESNISPLRQQPNNSNNSILTDLARGSELLYLGELEDWYKVQYGITETYLSKSDVRPIWRPTNYIDELSIVTLPNIPFGNVDVERDIPTLLENRTVASNAIIIANEFYGGGLQNKRYAERDGKLLEEYFINTLGLGYTNLARVINQSNPDQYLESWSLLEKISSEEKQVILYLNGYASIGKNNNLTYLLGDSEHYFNFESIVDQVVTLGYSSLILIADVNYDYASGTPEQFYQAILQMNDQLVNSNLSFSMIFSSDGRSQSQLYTKQGLAQKYHSIFSYYLADALKKGSKSTNMIINHLQRNVDYTSRRLHNEPQNILFFGNHDTNW
jgi:hypothetical protein